MREITTNRIVHNFAHSNFRLAWSGTHLSLSPKLTVVAVTKPTVNKAHHFVSILRDTPPLLCPCLAPSKATNV